MWEVNKDCVCTEVRLWCCKETLLVRVGGATYLVSVLYSGTLRRKSCCATLIVHVLLLALSVLWKQVASCTNDVSV